MSSRYEIENQGYYGRSGAYGSNPNVAPPGGIGSNNGQHSLPHQYQPSVYEGSGVDSAPPGFNPNAPYSHSIGGGGGGGGVGEVHHHHHYNSSGPQAAPKIDPSRVSQVNDAPKDRSALKMLLVAAIVIGFAAAAIYLSFVTIDTVAGSGELWKICLAGGGALVSFAMAGVAFEAKEDYHMTINTNQNGKDTLDYLGAITKGALKRMEPILKWALCLAICCGGRRRD